MRVRSLIEELQRLVATEPRRSPKRADPARLAWKAMSRLELQELRARCHFVFSIFVLGLDGCRIIKTGSDHPFGTLVDFLCYNVNAQF